jgi:hypothetical protein
MFALQFTHQQQENQRHSVQKYSSFLLKLLSVFLFPILCAIFNVLRLLLVVIVVAPVACSGEEWDNCWWNQSKICSMLTVASTFLRASYSDEHFLWTME